MEFLDNHFEITNTELQILIDFTVNSFKTNFEIGISEVEVIDITRRRIWDEVIETSFINKYKDHFEEAYRIYRLSIPKYNNDRVDAVKSVLKKEAHEEFLKRLKINKVPNYIYDEDFDNITYETFVAHLLKYDVYQKCYYRLSANMDLYKLFYETEDYKEFTFEDFKGHVVNSTLFRKIFSEYYPNKTIPIAVKRIDDYQNIVYDLVYDDEELNIPIANPRASFQKDNNFKMDIKNDIYELDNTQRSFLFHVMCKALSENSVAKQVEKNDKSFNLPATELCKLSIIVDVQNKYTFDSIKYRDSDHYKILRIGIEFVEKKDRIYFIQTLLEKIKDLKLIKTTIYIKAILNKEHNNLIKPKN